VKLRRHDVHALTGAYAVDAIDDENERDKFERHMARCQQCAGEVRGLTETATRLALAASRPPPVLLRGRVLTAVSQTRQLPPITEHSPARPWHAWPWWTSKFTVLSYGLVAVSVGVIIALGIVLASARSQLTQAEARNTALAAVLSAPDARSVSQAVSVGGRATVVYSLRRHAMIFTPHGLPPLPPGKVYQLWLIAPHRFHSAGLLPVSPAAQSMPILAYGVMRRDVVGLTVEPAGGTKTPTTTPILLITLRA
jgi:hypothetical protein